MATSFPTSIDTFTNPVATNPTNSPSHATQHTHINDAVLAIETAIGTTASPVLAPVNSASGATASTPTFSNGVAAQLAQTTRDAMVYLTEGTAGTAMVITIGPTNTPANTVVSSSVATGGEVYAIRLPAGWYLKWSATTATIANQLAITC